MPSTIICCWRKDRKTCVVVERSTPHLFQRHHHHRRWRADEDYPSTPAMDLATSSACMRISGTAVISQNCPAVSAPIANSPSC